MRLSWIVVCCVLIVVVVPRTFKLPEMVAFPATEIEPAKPAPPATTNAPVEGETLSTVDRMAAVVKAAVLLAMDVAFKEPIVETEDTNDAAVTLVALRFAVEIKLVANKFAVVMEEVVREPTANEPAVKEPLMTAFPPTYMFCDKPSPPLTTNAPVEVPKLAVESVICTEPPIDAPPSEDKPP
jgi:hypothetical protein